MTKQEPPRDYISGGLLLNKEYYDWADKAVCNELHKEHPDFFFEKKTAAAAKLLCRYTCEVRRECFLFAMINEEEGIWGGFDDKERKLAKKENPVLCSPQQLYEQLLSQEQTVILGSLLPSVPSTEIVHAVAS